MEQILSSVAIRIDGPTAWDLHVVLSTGRLDSAAALGTLAPVAGPHRTQLPDRHALMLSRR